jgi:hypothetical protein
MTRLAALVRHPLAIAGAALATASGVAFVALAVAAFAGLFDNPYAGLVVFVVLPALLIVGLLCIPAGVWLQRRRRGADWASEDWPVVDFRIARVRRATLLIAALTIFNVVIVLLAGYGGLHAMESPAFCGAVCHTPMQPQFVAWREGPHAGTACVQCHIGEGPAAFIHAKLAGVRQLAHVMTNSYARPTPPGTDMPPGTQAQTCAGCHRPGQAGPDRLLVIREYGDDEANSETTTTLQLRMSAIHWHADPANRVEYMATDETRETIPYVKVTRASGDVREYLADGVNEHARRAGSLRTMDCVDCHNTVGHPIAPSAEQAVDAAMASGRISRQLPYARREGVRLMKVSYGSEDEAAGAIDRDFRGFYQSRAGAVDEKAIERTVAALRALYRRNVFPAMKVTWGSYPDNRGHLTATGCFRCHDGSHTDTTGAAITADCESCHREVVASE